MQPSTPLTHIRCLFPSISPAFSFWCSFFLAPCLELEVKQMLKQSRSLHSLYHPSLLLTWRNGLYDSTFCSKLSFKAHLGVLRIFSTCQLIWDILLQKSCFFTIQVNKTHNRYSLWSRRYVTLQRYKGTPEAVPVSKRLRVKWEMQKDKCKAVCKNSTKEGAAELGISTRELEEAGWLHGESDAWANLLLSSPLLLLFTHLTPFPSPVLMAATDNVYKCLFLLG